MESARIDKVECKLSAFTVIVGDVGVCVCVCKRDVSTITSVYSLKNKKLPVEERVTKRLTV